MKTSVLLSAFMVIGMMTFSFGQEQKNDELKTIFKKGDHKISHGGYIAISPGYTRIQDENAMTFGGRAGWLIDHHVTIGLAGTAFVSNPSIEGDFPDAPENGLCLTGGYGGLFVEPIIAPNFPLHVSFPVIIGGGGIALNEKTTHDYDWDDDYYYDPYNWDSFFVVEPGVEVELNVVKFFRIAFGASYRFTSDLHMANVPADMLYGFNGNVTLKFGRF